MPLGSCQPENYPALLAEKVSRLQQLLSPFNAPQLDVHESPTSGFRMRAEFRFWHDGDDGNYVMFAKGDNETPIIINEFPIADEHIQTLMPTLRQAILASPGLRKKLFQVEFLATLSGDMLVTLIYHKPLDEHWQAEALQLEQTLGISIIGRSRKQKLVLSRDYVDETLQVNQQVFHYRQYEGGFSQPNAHINQAMLAWAQAQLCAMDGDFLELYCGNGNFTVALAQQFRKVLATEMSKTSVKAALENFARNGINNANVCRLSSEEFTEALNQTRSFRRLQEQAIDLNDYQFSAVLVDPPRAGLDTGTCTLIQRVNHILYISCNPETLARDLQQLCQTHTIFSAALFDQFPYTEHIETGVFLVAK